MMKTPGCAVFAVVLLSFAAAHARADQVEMQNGDHYVGNVVSLNADTLVLQNEVLGTVQLPRSKVAEVRLGAARPAGSAAQAPPSMSKTRVVSTTGSSGGTNFAAGLSQLGAHTNLIRHVQQQFLAGAGPEANQKFDELLNGLMSGKLTMDDLRSQAQSAADQLRSLKRQGGEDAGFATDTYLAILDQFLKETASTGSSMTNAAAPASGAKAGPLQPED